MLPASPRQRRLLIQAAVVVLLLVAAAVLWRTAAHNLSAQQLRSGFGFLRDPAGFDIGETLIDYSPRDAYARAFLVGLLNTVRVALAGIVTATIVGVLIGLGQLARNRLIGVLCTAYVEVARNIPLLVQLLAIYLALTQLLPDLTTPLHLWGGALLSKAGLHLPWPAQQADGWRVEVPQVEGLSIVGGFSLSAEFVALWSGLTLFTGAYIGEIVRAGVLAVPRGQWEAALAVGLTRRSAMSHVIVPQALRLIVPPLTSQYLNLTKNSSLAVAIGYPDIVSIANTAINQNGQAIECIAIIVSVYLGINAVTALVMNVYNRRVTRKVF